MKRTSSAVTLSAFLCTDELSRKAADNLSLIADIVSRATLKSLNLSNWRVDTSFLSPCTIAPDGASAIVFVPIPWCICQ